MSKKNKDINYQEWLMQELQDPELALEYINQALMDEDQRVFLIALKDVLEAQGGDMSALAKKASLNRQNLYRILSPKGNPKLTSVRSLLNALGLELAVQQHKK